MALGLPSYSSLIREIGEHLGFDGEIYEGFGDYLTLAEYYQVQQGGLTKLKSYLAKRLKKSRAEIINSIAHQSLVNLKCRLIYTTNFDRVLEEAHRGLGIKYRTIRSAKDLINLHEDQAHIVKYHGDLSDLRSLVFTESSYFKRLDFEDPLDIKLRHDVLGKSLLFIGYSLSDINIKYLLYRLQKQWENQKNPELRPTSYVFLSRPNEILSKTLELRGVKTRVADSINQTDSLARCLTELRVAADVLHSDITSTSLTTNIFTRSLGSIPTR